MPGQVSSSGNNFKASEVQNIDKWCQKTNWTTAPKSELPVVDPYSLNGWLARTDWEIPQVMPAASDLSSARDLAAENSEKEYIPIPHLPSTPKSFQKLFDQVNYHLKTRKLF